MCRQPIGRRWEYGWDYDRGLIGAVGVIPTNRFSALRIAGGLKGVVGGRGRVAWSKDTWLPLCLGGLSV